MYNQERGTMLFLWQCTSLLSLFIHVWVCAKDCCCKTLCLIAESVDVCILFTIAERYTHAATEVCFWLAENTYTGTLFCKGIHEVILRCCLVVLVSKDNSRDTSMLKADIVDRKTENGTEMKFKL